ncbi:uncharacterized protein LOC142345732 isoform X2 [Convolutriloba macropyga]|uniref:uncharacterized protein LOC142345732 isoform X2 n=1 Tax=Convolutriloba macropyga TaxID=536237 RepID=UPI003F527408
MLTHHIILYNSYQFNFQVPKSSRLSRQLQDRASILLIITALFFYTTGEALPNGCSFTRSNDDGLCLTSGSDCCTTSMGDVCSRQFVNQHKKPPGISMIHTTIFLLEEKNLFCWKNLSFREKNGTFDSLVGVKAEVTLTKHSLFDHVMGHRVNEFLFDPTITNSDMPHFLKSTTMCMFTGYHGKLSDIRSDPRIYLTLVLSTIPPTLHELPHSFPGNPIQLSKIPRATLSYEGCRVKNFTIIPFKEKEVPEIRDWAIIGSSVVAMFLLAIIGALIYCKSKSMYRKRNEVPADQLALKTISPRPFASSQENVAPSGIAPTPGPSSDGGKCSRQRSDSLKDGEALTQC